MPSLSRRNFLGLTVTGAATALAGCIESPLQNTPSETTTTAHQTPTSQTHDAGAGPAPSCPGELSAFDPHWVVEGSGPLAGFTLTVNRRTVAIGDTLAVSLRNSTDATQMTGNKRKYDVQYRGSSGWHTIFGLKDNYVWDDIGIEHEPNHAFTWQFPVTRDGLSNITETSPYGVCAPITPGTYRFVYWGVTTDREEAEDYETDYALGVPFTVSEG